MIRILSLFLFLQLLSPQELVSGCSEQIVYVINTLPVASESPLKVHCEFGGQDLGVHVLYHDQDFHWSLCDTSQGRTMSCQLSWGSKNIAFEAFKESGIHISESFWSARSDAIYLRDSVGNEKQVPWKN